MAQGVEGIAPCPSVALLAVLPWPVTMDGWLCLAAIFFPLWLASLVWVHRDNRRVYDTAAPVRHRWNAVALLLPLIGALAYAICRPSGKTTRRAAESPGSPQITEPQAEASCGLRLRMHEREWVELLSNDGKRFEPRAARGVWAGWQTAREVLSDAVHQHIHEIVIEPQRHECVVRWHRGPASQRYRTVSLAEGLQLIATLKHLAGLPLAKPSAEVGRFRGRATRGEFEVAVRATAGNLGEKLHIELHSHSAVAPSLEHIGAPTPLTQELRRVASQRNGLLLIAGPQSLTKTVIRSINTHLAPNLLETEEPTRPVRAAEIAETASTHHLVATPLSVPTALDALIRWVEWHGARAPIIPPLQLIIAVRPIRWLCSECRTPYRPPPDDWSVLGTVPHNPIAFRATGCAACQHTGYRRDGALWEWLPTDRTIQRIVLDVGSPTDLVQRVSLKPWQQFRADALEKILQGQVSLADATRALSTELSYV